MANLLNSEQIEGAISDLPLQGRIMLHLLLLQYFDMSSDEIGYIAADRPDPRIVAGAKPTAPVISRETLDGIAKRVADYRTQLRQRRERAWWGIECLRKLIALDRNVIKLAERLLTSRFGVTPEALGDLAKQARTTVHRPLLRDLDRRWESDEISQEDYLKARLQIELQSLIRRVEREQRRLEIAQRDFETASTAAHQDHEVAQMWGIPNGTLAARKVKYLHQYLEALQKRLAASRPPGQEAALAPVDLWRETYRTLALMPVERTVAAYDGLEGSEEELLEKLAIFAAGKMPEDQETKFWASLIQEFRHRAEYGSTPYSLFGLQRLSAMLEETDTSSDALEHDLIARISPAPKAMEASLDEAGKPKPELGQIGEHVLRSMFGEDR
jgi:hypothetical protein